MKAMVYDHFEEKEVEVDLEKATGLKIGDRVTHRNAGQHGGNATIISDKPGTVTGISYSGMCFDGSHFYVVNVKWDDREEFSMRSNLAVKIKE